MSYIYLALAIAGELLGTALLKYSEGFTKLYASIGCVVAYLACFFFLSKAISNINLSIAYATWCGVGIIATTLISMLVFKEEITFLGAIGIILIVAGVVIMNLFGTVTK